MNTKLFALLTVVGLCATQSNAYQYTLVNDTDFDIPVTIHFDGREESGPHLIKKHDTQKVDVDFGAWCLDRSYPFAYGDIKRDPVKTSMPDGDTYTGYKKVSQRNDTPTTIWNFFHTNCFNQTWKIELESEEGGTCAASFYAPNIDCTKYKFRFVRQ